MAYQNLTDAEYDAISDARYSAKHKADREVVLAEKAVKIARDWQRAAAAFVDYKRAVWTAIRSDDSFDQAAKDSAMNEVTGAIYALDNAIIVQNDANNALMVAEAAQTIAWENCRGW